MTETRTDAAERDDDLRAPRWRGLREPDDVVDALLDLYDEQGSERYDDAVTQAEHALQCGALAMPTGPPTP